MKLRPAPGGPEMVNALSDQNVHGIVTTLLGILNQEFFRNVANFLVKFNQRSQTNFIEALEDLRESFLTYPNEQGLYPTPEFVTIFISRLQALYQQNERNVGFLRGAIVERLTSELISTRCQPGECRSNQKFFDEHGKAITGQIDVTVLSHNNLFIEGYECKIKAEGLMSEDCDNLKALALSANREDYYVLVGVTAFVAGKIITRKLEHWNAPFYITAYGLDDLTKLRNTPDYLGPDDSLE